MLYDCWYIFEFFFFKQNRGFGTRLDCTLIYDREDDMLKRIYSLQDNTDPLVLIILIILYNT